MIEVSSHRKLCVQPVMAFQYPIHTKPKEWVKTVFCCFKTKEHFIKNVSGHMSTCRNEEIIKRQIAIFLGAREDLALKLEKATGVKGYDGIANIYVQRHS